MINDQYFKDGGPVFLLFGGEGEASPKWLSAETHIVQMARTHNALLLQLEHRFYGESHPTEDMSTSNLRYLTSQQALADGALFRNNIMKMRQLPGETKWVVFGGSYSGSLAAWFKLKFPHLAVGAVASSAPMLALINFQDYFRVVRNSLGTDCSAQVKEGVQTLELMAAKRDQWSAIDSKFKTCLPFDSFNRNNLENFFQTVAGNFAGVVQYNKDQRIGGASNITVDTLCNIMAKTEKSAVDRLAEINDVILQSSGQKCMDYDYDEFIRQMRQTSFNSSAAEGGRQWTYQTCVEFGFFQGSDAKDQPFGHLFPAEFFVQQCRDMFDDFFDHSMLKRAIFETNTEYGAQQPSLRNVTFPNGSVDPWHALSILEDMSEDVTAIYIDGTAHCADMYPASDNDNSNLTQARKKIEGKVRSFLE